MKKTLIAITIMFTALFVHAQTTVVVQRPGLLTDLAGAAGALVELPAALAEGIVVGAAEAAGSLIHGSTQVYVVPQTPVVTTTPVVTSPVITTVPGYTTPIVTTPAPVVTRPVVVAPAPATTTITTTTHSIGGTVTTTVTRPISSYETPSVGRVIVPVPVEHRVGPSPLANPYVFRPR